MKKLILLLIVFFAIAGCSMVTIRDLPGEAPLKISAPDWDGIWYDGEKTVVFISVSDENSGILKVKAVEGEGEELKVKKFTLFLRNGKNILYAGVYFGEIADKDEVNNSNRDRYVWGVIKLLNGRILFFPPEGKSFRELIDEGVLKGKAGKGYVHIDSSWKDVEKTVRSNLTGHFYDMKNPVVLSRIK